MQNPKNSGTCERPQPTKIALKRQAIRPLNAMDVQAVVGGVPPTRLTNHCTQEPTACTCA